MTTELNEAEMKQLDWWCRHHKQNSLYLCQRMLSMIEAMDALDGEKITMYKNMMKVQLPAFFETATRGLSGIQG